MSCFQVQRKFEAPWLGAHGETRLWLMSLHPQWAATAAGGEVPQRGVACRVTEVLSHPAVMETCWEGSEPSPKVAKYSNHEAGKVGGTAGRGEGGFRVLDFENVCLDRSWESQPSVRGARLRNSLWLWMIF